MHDETGGEPVKGTDSNAGKSSKQSERKQTNQSMIDSRQGERMGKPGEKCRKGQRRSGNNGQQSIIVLNITDEDTK